MRPIKYQYWPWSNERHIAVGSSTSFIPAYTAKIMLIWANNYDDDHLDDI